MKFLPIVSLILNSSVALTACQSTSSSQPSPIQPSATQEIVNESANKTATPPVPKLQTPIRMCTMQYDPVCGKIIENGKASYHTFSNACVAGNTANLVSVTKGSCGSDNLK